MSKLFSNYYKFLPIILILFVLLFLLDAEKQNSDYSPSADSVALQDSTRQIKMDKSVFILEDIEGEMQIDDVSQPPVSWEFFPNAKGTLNKGYTSSVYWIQFNVINEAPEKIWLLELAAPSLDNVILYSPLPNGGFSSKEAGRKIPAAERDFYNRNIVFNLNFEDQKTGTFYLRIQSAGPLQLPVSIWDQTAFEEKTHTLAALAGLLNGIGIMVLFFYLVQFIKYRQHSYLYFLFFALSVFFAVSSMAGLAFGFISPNIPWWNEHSVLFFTGIGSIFLLLFTEKFLDTRRHLPFSRKIFKFLTRLLALLLFVLFVSYISVRMVLPVLLLITTALVVIVSAVCWKKGIKYARYFTFASFFLLCGFGLTFLIITGLIPLTNQSRQVGYAAIAAGMFLSAFSLSDKAAAKNQEKVERERKAAERQRLAMESLKHANEQKDELLTITSHSLRTPLYGMIGIAESMQEVSAGRIPPVMNNQLGTIISSGKKLAHIINNILDYSKLKQNTMNIHVEPVNLSILSETVLAVCSPLIKSGNVRLYGTIPINLPQVIADPDRVQQILYNLIGNSIKYTETGEIVVSAKKSGKQVIISVRDTGIGIQEEKIPALFEPFHKKEDTEGDLGGAGIGLNISKRLVELQGGWLKAESKMGAGSTFSFALPIYHKEEITEMVPLEETAIKELTASQLSESISKRRKSSKQIRILVVDHEEVNRQMLIFQLQREGYAVIGASLGKEVIQLLAEQPIDLVILDWSLADMTGDELCRHVRKNFTLTELPILMLSDKRGLQEKTDAFTAGANDYLIKPCDKEEFLLRVDTLANLRSLTQEITNMNYYLEQNVKERTMALEITNMNLVTVNDEIQEIEKSRNEMLSTISHELGTPITLIHSYIQAVKESIIDEKNPRYLDMIHNKLLLLERLTEDLVELGKYKSGNMTLRFENIKAGDWLERLINGMESDVIQSGRMFEYIKTEREAWEENFILAIDSNRIDQVFSNVLWNAVKHTSSIDGKISISAEIYASGREGAVLELEDFDGEIIVKVADTGNGIAQEVLPHIFDRFFKVDDSSKQKGSGLGLAIAKEIILSHKGEIWAESEVGKGSAFYIALPLTF